jgi:hypothetical protein
VRAWFDALPPLLKAAVLCGLGAVVLVLVGLLLWPKHEETPAHQRRAQPRPGPEPEAEPDAEPDQPPRVAATRKRAGQDRLTRGSAGTGAMRNAHDDADAAADHTAEIRQQPPATAFFPVDIELPPVPRANARRQPQLPVPPPPPAPPPPPRETRAERRRRLEAEGKGE